MPVSSLRKLNVNVMIDEVANKNELLSLPIAIHIDRHPQPVDGR